MKGVLKNSGFAARIFLFLLIFILCVYTGITFELVFFDKTAEELWSLKTIVLIHSLMSFVLPSIVFAYLCSERPLKSLSFNVKPDWKSLLTVFLMMAVAIPFINWLSDLNRQISFPSFLSGVELQIMLLEKQAALQTDKLLTATGFGGLLFNLFLMAAVPAVGEELFFRGTLQNLFRDRLSNVWAVWLAAFVFSVIHMQFYGFIPRMLIGAFFGFLLVWSGGICLPILAHFTNNAFIVVFHFLLKNGFDFGNLDLETLGTGKTWWTGALCGLVFVVATVCLRSRLRRKAR